MAHHREEENEVEYGIEEESGHWLLQPFERRSDVDQARRPSCGVSMDGVGSTGCPLSGTSEPVEGIEGGGQ